MSIAIMNKVWHLIAMYVAMYTEISWYFPTQNATFVHCSWFSDLHLADKWYINSIQKAFDSFGIAICSHKAKYEVNICSKLLIQCIFCSDFMRQVVFSKIFSMNSDKTICDYYIRVKYVTTTLMKTKLAQTV